jgi:hypothetical protein
MIIICVYVPYDKLQTVAEAMFLAGAGKIGNYTKCCYFSEGIGQFLPLDNSQPHIGTKLKVNQAAEYRLEIIVSEKDYEIVIQAMLASHPYEEPVWHAFRSLGPKI